jgi:hypothetical protein
LIASSARDARGHETHHLIALQDSEAARITHTLDAMGNRTAEQAYDPAGLLARSRTRVYDALNRLKHRRGQASPLA